MEKNPLKRVEALGQAIWLDYIKRELVTSGKLKKLIVEDGLRGITSNPSIFEKAFSESHDYDQDIRKLTQEGKTVAKIYEVLTQQDVQAAADEFHALYQQTHGQDGYVSLEVNPYLAHDTQGTVEEGRRLWKALNRPNVLIKVPATSAGLPAIQQLITEGISINVTLIFGLSRYQEVIEAYMAGLEARLAAGNAVASLASVASFFLSRIDALLDPLFEKRGAEKALSAALTTALEGQTAIASAKIAYQRYTELFTSARFKKLAEKGAQPQRLLWAISNMLKH
jgi:transaldolase/transaldolase/glucose-6-phosphate isomerase